MLETAMSSLAPRRVMIEVSETQRVSALLLAPAKPRAAYAFAHGAGAGMEHAFMSAVAEGLAEREVATLRFQFPYMENGSRRPDPPTIAQATVRAAVERAGREWPDAPLFAGGKSFGGRMTSQAQSASPLTSTRGLIFVGFPLHPAGKPSTDRAKHLAEVRVPMLFLQGTRDELATLSLLEPTVRQLGHHTTLHLIPEADHAFHVPARTGRKDADVRQELLDTMTAWMCTVAAGRE